MSVPLEWVRISPETMIIATPERAWVHTVLLGLDDPFVRPMTGRGSVATTSRLLDGAIGTAARRFAPGRPAPALTLAQWVWRLAGYYCTTHPTPSLMAEAARRFSSEGRTELAMWAAAKAREESGHHLLALRDIEALSYDAAGVVTALVPATARALVEYFTAAVQRPEGALGCVGYSYVLERLALERDARYLAAVQAIVPPGIDATRCLRVHSALGSDARHVEETIALVADLPADERAYIAAACFETALRFYAPPEMDPPTEAELVAVLAAHQHKPPSSGCQAGPE